MTFVSRIPALVALLLAMAVWGPACGGDDGAIGGDAGADAGADAFSCGTANDIGVGATCSAGGNECRAFGQSGANLCSCDFVMAEFCACSRMCTGDGECGSGGAKCCTLMTPIGPIPTCVPGGCLEDGACPAP